MKRLFAIGLLAVVAAAGGCISFGGSPKSIYSEPTLGKQLQDLRAARDCGVITAEEYAIAKSRLIRGGHGD